MRKFVLALLLALIAFGAGLDQAAGGEAFDFGDMPPLPPPLLDDTPSPPPLTPTEGSALSPLVQPPGGSSPVAPTAPTTTGRSPLTPPSLTPIAPPPLAPPSSDGSGQLALPGEVSTGTGATAVAPTPSIPETPRTAKISGGRVNVRAGPNTQYESIAVLTTGAPVTVLAKNGEWFKIIYPADQLASIHKNFVDADISGEIPEAGLPGIVNQDNADVHAYYWDKSTVVGTLKKGDPVTIKQERGQWYRIAAPDTARAYVFAEYVRVDGNQQVAVDSDPAPTNPAVDLAQGKQDATGRLKMSETDVRATQIKENYFKQLRERQAREEEEAQVSVNRLEEALDELDAKISAINAESAYLYSYSATTTDVGSAAWAPPDPIYGGFTGWVENIGRVGGAPASFRLTKGGEIRFYLRSDRFNLNDFVGRRVWVNGNVELASGAVANVLNVDQVRILTEMEIAEGMRQYQVQTYGAPSVPAQSYDVIEPYTPPGSSDPYAGYYQTHPAPSASPYMDAQPAPVVPSDPSQLPDVVGSNYGGGVITSSVGEVDTDFFENPVISEIGPQ